MKNIIRLITLMLILSLPSALMAQTTTNSTTLSAAVSSSTRTVTVASASGITVGHAFYVDQENMGRVLSISGTTITLTGRGTDGTSAAAHPSGAVVYTGPAANGPFTSSRPPSGSCTAGAGLFGYSPLIHVPSGELYECQASRVSLKNKALQTATSVWFNLDNGAGTTIDDVILRATRPVQIVAARIIYVDATTGTVAGGNAAIGTTVGGAEIVAATAYANTAAVGSTTAMTIVNGAVAANAPVIVRHTGVAVTQAGQAVVAIDFYYR